MGTTKALSEDISRNLVSEIKGPIVLQIQRVKNIAVPSTKQHNPSPSRRLLRVQLTDGHVHVSAVEFEGPINNLRYAESLCCGLLSSVPYVVTFDPI